MDVESFVVFLVMVIVVLILWYAFLCVPMVAKRQKESDGINRHEDSSRISPPQTSQLENIEEFDEDE